MLTICVKRWLEEHKLSSYPTREVPTLVYNTTVLQLFDYLISHGVESYNTIRIDYRVSNTCRSARISTSCTRSLQGITCFRWSNPSNSLSYHKITFMCHCTKIVSITGEPAGQVSFINSRMHTRLMGQYNMNNATGLLYVSKPLITV